MMGVKGWVTHVHRTVAIVVWLEGETGDITIDRVRCARAAELRSHQRPAAA